MPREDWSAAAVEDIDKLHETHIEREITEALAWYLLDIGIGRVDEKNFSEIIRRIRQVEEVAGPKLRIRAEDGSYPLTPIHTDSIRRRFGMRSNVTPLSRTAFQELIRKERARKDQYLAEQARYEASKS